MTSSSFRGVLLSLVGVIAAGCAGVREDRGVAFTPDGEHAGFQHGKEGVFLVENGVPRKIFQPASDVIATSPPQWAPNDRRLIFTTAVRTDRTAPAKQTEPDPAGDLHFPGPTRYTCWLRPEAKGTEPAECVALFEAACDHPGYVAANLAVRWGPNGKEVFHVREVAPGRHALFAIDLESKRLRQVFPHEAAALVFGWSADRQALAVVVSGSAEHSPHDGVWVGRPGADTWWHVPGSEALAPTAVPLERVQAALPLWSPDSTRFVLPLARDAGQADRLYSLQLVTPATRAVEELAHGKQRWQDLHWRPDGTGIGAVEISSTAEGTNRLVLLRPGKEGAVLLVTPPVEAFAGWDARGEQMAYVARNLAREKEPSWAFLFVPDRLAQQALHVRKEGEAGPGRVVFKGMQVTFPAWAPDGKRLALWATFRPPYRSWPSLMQELGATSDDPLNGLRLRLGDPAVLLDPARGELSWQATSGREMEQVGHSYLQKRDYAEALRWYERARKAPAAGPTAPGDDAGFFRSYCLARLGRQEDADAEHRRFDQVFLKSFRHAQQARNRPQQPLTPFGAASIDVTDEQVQHWQDLYEAEVFLALDATEDGEAFFRKALSEAKEDATRLSKAVVLSQFLLFNHKNSECADLLTDEVLPRLLRSWKPRPVGNAGAPLASDNALRAYGDALALLPLAAGEFLDGLAVTQVRSLVTRWRKTRELADDDVKKLVVDAVLAAAHRRLGEAAEAEKVERRLTANPMRFELLGEKGVPGLIEGLRAAPELVESWRNLVRQGGRVRS
jgi:hypothetical protein